MIAKTHAKVCTSRWLNRAKMQFTLELGKEESKKKFLWVEKPTVVTVSTKISDTYSLVVKSYSQKSLTEAEINVAGVWNDTTGNKLWKLQISKLHFVMFDDNISGINLCLRAWFCYTLTNLSGSVICALILSCQLFCKVKLGSKSVMRVHQAVAVTWQLVHSGVFLFGCMFCCCCSTLCTVVLQSLGCAFDSAAALHEGYRRKKNASTFPCYCHDNTSLLFEPTCNYNVLENLWW